MNTPANTVATLLQSYAAAVYDKDVGAFAALYAPDAYIFDTWVPWRYQGAEPWAAMAKSWFQSLGDDRVAVTWNELHAQDLGDAIAAQAFVTYTAVSQSGQKLRAMTNRLTWIARFGPDGWRIVHEHTSAPAEHETGRLVLQRGDASEGT